MAKKKYYQTKTDRRNESVGMNKRLHEREERRWNEGESDYDNSRDMMARNGDMIREDRSAPCNLPREVMDKYWPKTNNYNAGYVDDLFRGVEKQMDEDFMDLKKATGPGKY